MEIPKNPTVKHFYFRQKQMLSWFALWPPKDDATLANKILHAIFFWGIYIILIFWFGLSMLIKLIDNITVLDEIMKVFYIFVTIISYEMKFINVKLNNRKYLKLFEHIHDDAFSPRNNREREIFRKAGILSCKVRNIYGLISATTLNALILMSIFIEGRELPFSTYSIFNIEHTWAYVTEFLYQYIALTITACVDVAFDSFCPSMYIFIMAQLDILADRLIHLCADHCGSADITAQLQHCAAYYTRIEKLSRSVEKIVTWPISVQIFCSVLVLVANLYAMSTLADDYKNFIRFFIYQICMLSQIFLFCYFAHGIMDKSDQLSHALYSANWLNWSEKDKKIMQLMMLRFSKSIRIRTINRNYAFSLMAFSSIVNNSYSYFALLKRVNR